MVSAAEQLAANMNLGAFSKAEDLKKRIWFTLAALVVFRLGTFIPLPGINIAAYGETFKSQAGGILGMFNMFSGGALERMAIFALNIMPYISASIIMQLMSSINPKLEALKKEGEAGRKQINQYTRYLTVFLAAFQAYRAYDDFEKQALHGAFLIDGDGLVRWQDIGFQPFRDPKWLLGESKRLLSIPASRNIPAASTATAGR